MSDQHRTGDDTTSSGQPAAAFFASPEPESPSPRGSASASASASGESSATGEATGKAAGSAAGESADSPDAATVEEHLTGKKTSASTTTTARAASSSASATTDGHDEAEPEADPDPDPEAETEAETVSGKKAESEGRSEDSARSEESAPAPKARRGWGRVATVSGADGRPDGAAAAAAATTIGPGGDSPDADGGLSGRPKKPLLAGAAMAGAILVAVPLLIMATGKDDDDSKKVASSSSADTVLDDDGGRAGEFVAESPSPKKSKPEKKEKEKEKEKESPSPAKEKAADPSPPSSSPTAKEEEKKKTSVRKKAPSNLPAVLTRVLIKNNTNGTCVDVPGFTSGNPDGPIHQSACNSNPDDNQLWNVEKRYDSKGPGGVPLFQIRNVMDGMCLDLPGYGAAGNATKVTEFPCNGTTADNQLWWLDKQADGRFWIRNFASNNTCLDSYGPDDQTRDLIIWPCAPENLNNHEWYFTRS